MVYHAADVARTSVLVIIKANCFYVVAPVPSELIEEEFIKNALFDGERLKEIAAKCLLLPQTVQFYVNHLKQVKINRERGVEKSKQTRLANKRRAGQETPGQKVVAKKSTKGGKKVSYDLLIFI